MNKIMIMGNLGQDPDSRFTQDGTCIANLSVATSRSYKNKDGEKVDETEWHRVSAFGRRAEVICEYFSKGDKILIEGRVQTRKWQDKDGNDRYTTEIIMENFEFVTATKKRSAPQAQHNEKPSQPSDSEPEFDDDIPF